MGYVVSEAEDSPEPGDGFDQRVELGKRIRARREELALSQTEVGGMAGVHRVTVRSVETGKVAEDRTVANIKRALGCAPTVNYADREESRAGIESLRPVLSARSAMVVTSVLLNPTSPEPPTVTDYFELVNSLSQRPPDLPTSFPRFWDALVRELPPSEVAPLEIEIYAALGLTPPKHATAHDTTGMTDSVSATVSPATIHARAAIPAVQVSGTVTIQPGQLPNAIVGAIVNSGLPPQMQQILIDAMLRRQSELQAGLFRQLVGEVDTLIAATREAVGKAHDALPHRRQP